MTNTSPKRSARGLSDGFLNRRSQVRFLPRAPLNPSDTTETAFRAIACAGLWPLLDALVRGGLQAYQATDAHALVALGLAERHAQGLVPTGLALEALHQVAAHQRAWPVTVPAEARGAWTEIVLVRGEASDRGRMLLAWLRLGTLTHACSIPGCLDAVAGVRRCGVEQSVDLACAVHRLQPRLWGALIPVVGIGGAPC